MAEISNDPSKYARRVRDSKLYNPYTPNAARRDSSGLPSQEQMAPLVRPDLVTVGESLDPSSVIDEENIAPEQMDAWVEKLKAMPDIDEARVNRAIDNMEGGYEPDQVLGPLVDRMIEEGDIQL